jgi:hypothetical protein
MPNLFRRVLDRHRTATEEFHEQLTTLAASILVQQRCPDCGHDRFHGSEDGGHDVVLECANCYARFGVQLPPFNLVERL